MSIIVVGGGVAGASLAIALGRAGHAVELFDAQTFLIIHTKAIPIFTML